MWWKPLHIRTNAFHADISSYLYTNYPSVQKWTSTSLAKWRQEQNSRIDILQTRKLRMLLKQLRCAKLGQLTDNWLFFFARTNSVRGRWRLFDIQEINYLVLMLFINTNQCYFFFQTYNDCWPKNWSFHAARFLRDLVYGNSLKIDENYIYGGLLKFCRTNLVDKIFYFLSNENLSFGKSPLFVHGKVI